jgi:uncharacterized protein (DUF2235 family)
MKKNVVLFCDGTGNEYGPHNTNVVQSYEQVVRDADQVAFYDPGVGTFDALGRTVGKKLGTLFGKAFGWGLTRNIEDAYLYLMNRYVPGDDVYLFGFSRGAFTVRALAGMLHRCGLLQKGSTNLIPYASRVYNAPRTPESDEVAAGFKRTYCNECKPHLIGVWDTVGSLGHFFGKRFFDATLNRDVRHGYHAISIDEKRKKFPVSLWDEGAKAAEQTIEQVWFAGVHSDVGGWYDERGLSDTALLWMLARAEQRGLRLKDGWREALHPQPDDPAAQHESRAGWWKLWEPVQRPIPPGSLVHQSVLDRMQAVRYYAPRNLPHDHRVVPWD